MLLTSSMLVCTTSNPLNSQTHNYLLALDRFGHFHFWFGFARFYITTARHYKKHRAERSLHLFCIVQNGQEASTGHVAGLPCYIQLDGTPLPGHPRSSLYTPIRVTVTHYLHTWLSRGEARSDIFNVKLIT